MIRNDLSRVHKLALLVLSLVFAPAVVHADGAEPSVDLRPARQDRSGHKILGLAVDAGFPHIAGASLVLRPVSFLRLHGGMLHNYAGHGFRGGVTFRPSWVVAPSLTLEAGRFLDASAASKLGALSVKVPQEYQAALQKVGYTFASAMGGIEIGSPNGVVFFVHAGMSRVAFSSAATAEGLQRAVEQSGIASLKSLVRVNGNQAFAPSVQTGLIVHL